MDKEDELLCIRKVGKTWGTVTLPDELKDNNRVVFEKEIDSGRIYVRGTADNHSEDE